MFVLKGLAQIEARSARVDMAAALAVLAKVPGRPPLAGDEVSEARPGEISIAIVE